MSNPSPSLLEAFRLAQEDLRKLRESHDALATKERALRAERDRLASAEAQLRREVDDLRTAHGKLLRGAKEAEAANRKRRARTDNVLDHVRSAMADLDEVGVARSPTRCANSPADGMVLWRVMVFGSCFGTLFDRASGESKARKTLWSMYKSDETFVETMNSSNNMWRNVRVKLRRATGVGDFALMRLSTPDLILLAQSVGRFIPDPRSETSCTGVARMIVDSFERLLNVATGSVWTLALPAKEEIVNDRGAMRELAEHGIFAFDSPGGAPEFRFATTPNTQRVYDTPAIMRRARDLASWVNDDSASFGRRITDSPETAEIFALSTVLVLRERHIDKLHKYIEETEASRRLVGSAKRKLASCIGRASTTSTTSSAEAVVKASRAILSREKMRWMLTELGIGEDEDGGIPEFQIKIFLQPHVHFSGDEIARFVNDTTTTATCLVMADAFGLYVEILLAGARPATLMRAGLLVADATRLRMGRMLGMRKPPDGTWHVGEGPMDAIWEGGPLANTIDLLIVSAMGMCTLERSFVMLIR